MTTDPTPVRPDYVALNVQVVRCPTCRAVLPGLLALCRKPECLTAELDDDHAFARSQDQ